MLYTRERRDRGERNDKGAKLRGVGKANPKTWGETIGIEGPWAKWISFLYLAGYQGDRELCYGSIFTTKIL